MGNARQVHVYTRDQACHGEYKKISYAGRKVINCSILAPYQLAAETVLSCKFPGDPASKNHWDYGEGTSKYSSATTEIRRVKAGIPEYVAL